MTAYLWCLLAFTVLALVWLTVRHRRRERARLSDARRVERDDQERGE